MEQETENTLNFGLEVLIAPISKDGRTMTIAPATYAARESADHGPWTRLSTLWLVLCIGPLIFCTGFPGRAWHDVYVLAKQNPGTGTWCG